MSDNRKTTLIVNYYGMQAGGVETSFAELMLYAVSKGYRVIWLTTENCLKNATHTEITSCDAIEKVLIKSPTHAAYVDRVSCRNERVIVISCEPLTFARAESMRGKLGEASFENYLILPNFRGKIYFPEQFFTGGKKDRVLRQMASAVRKMNDADCLRGFAIQHLTAYEQNYGLTIKDKEKKLLGGLRRITEPEKSTVIKNAADRGKRFEITACSRFDFPHKGFILGLIREFAVLKEKYPQLSLTLIGDGAGMDRVKRLLEELPRQTAEAVRLTGTLPLDRVRELFRHSQLNVGLSGALLDGASCCVPSVVVRHFCEDCEAYGFLSNVPDRLSEKPGSDVKPIIEAVIRMSDEEYIKQAYRDYECAKKVFDYRPDYLFEQNVKQSAVLSKSEIFRLRMLKAEISLKGRFRDIDDFA
jgi:glycosyltransferase involved in cell wall biosynthesis